MAFDYETICYRLVVTDWPNLKERIDEPEIQAGFKSCVDGINNYIEKYDTFQTTGTDEDACFHAEWCGEAARLQFYILVDDVDYTPLEPYAEWLRKKKYEKKIHDIKPFEKELPDDVLTLIRQYAKPAFIHFREYNQALDLFHLTVSYKQKLKERILVPMVRDQLKICVDAHDDKQKIRAVYLHHKTDLNEELWDKSNYWTTVCKDKFVSLLDQSEYRQPGYAEWYFQDDINDAWMDDSDSSDDEDERLACLRQQGEWECYYIRKMKKETRMMEEEDRRGLNEIYDGLDGLYTVDGLVRLDRQGSAPIFVSSALV
jgi:hypothetical protein